MLTEKKRTTTSCGRARAYTALIQLKMRYMNAFFTNAVNISSVYHAQKATPQSKLLCLYPLDNIY